MIEPRPTIDTLLRQSLGRAEMVDCTASVLRAIRLERWLRRIVWLAAGLLSIGTLLSSVQFWFTAHEQSLGEVLRLYTDQFAWRLDVLLDLLSSVSVVFPYGSLALAIGQIAVLYALWAWRDKLLRLPLLFTN